MMEDWSTIEVAFAFLWFWFAGMLVLLVGFCVSILIINARTHTPHPPQTPPVAGAPADTGRPSGYGGDGPPEV